MHLSNEEKSALNQTISTIVPLQFPQTGSALSPLSSLSEKSFEFLDIHKKIELLKTIEIFNPAKWRLLDQIDEATRQFEKIVLETITKVDLNDSKQIKCLYRELNKLKNNPLLKEGNDENTRLLYEELKVLAKTVKSLAKSYQDIAFVQEKLEIGEQAAEKAMLLMNDQREALEKGESDLAVINDLSILDVINKFVQLYKKYGKKETLTLYHSEFLSNLTEQLRVIRFNREDYCTEYQEAVSVEVLKALKALQDKTSGAANQQEILLRSLIQAMEKILHSKSRLDYHVESLIGKEAEGLTERLFQEFSSIQRLVTYDLKFLEKQITMLKEKQTVGWWGRWTIHSRNKQVEHHVRKMKALEVEKPAGIGQKLLEMCMWGLYLTPQLHSLASFATQTYKAFSTGESPLKESADLMSTSAFVKRLNAMPQEKLIEIDFELSSLRGVLEGFIPLTQTFADQHPAVVDYVKSLQIERPSPQSRQLSGPGSHFPASLKILSPEQANYHLMKLLGERVREYFQSIGKQLSWENPLGSLPSSS